MINRDVLKLLGIKKTDNMFRRCIRKRPINTFTYTVDAVDDWTGQVGMIIPKGFIVIDVDDMDASDLLLEIINTNKINCIITETVRGRHFIFRDRKSHHIKQGSHIDTPIGIKVDTRTSGKGYVILPEGEEVGKRKYANVPKVVDEIPLWLIPDKRLSSFFAQYSLRLDEGSRDDTTFKYIMYLKDFTDYTYELVVDIMGIVNNHVFLEPLPNSAILGKIDAKEFKNDRIKYTKQEYRISLVDRLFEEYHFKKYYNDLYIYDGIKYTQVTQEDISHIMLTKYDNTLTKTDKSEIYSYVTDLLHDKSIMNTMISKNHITTPTQVIDMRTLDIYQNTHEHFSINNIYFDFNPHLESNKFVDKYMHSIFSTEEEIECVYEMIGNAMLNYIPFRSAYYIVGRAKSGKSFFLEQILKIYGQDNVSAIDPVAIEKDTRLAKNLGRKSVNLADDISSTMIRDDSLFKKLISGQPFEIDVKYGVDTLMVKPTATWIMTSNYDPKFKNSDDGIFSRLQFIPFTNVLKKVDINFEDKWRPEHYEYIVSRSIKAIHNALNRGNLIVPESFKDYCDNFILVNSSVLRFLDAEFPKGIEKQSCKVIFQEYKHWCTESENIRTTMTRQDFQSELLRNTDYVIKQTSWAEDPIDKGSIQRYVRK